MSKRISWKKGMRLTDEVLLAADNCTATTLSQSFMLASSGRFGLMPSIRPFRLSLSITSGYAEVMDLDMLAITRAGDVIDMSITGNLADTSTTRVPLPDNDDEAFLIVNIEPNSWQDDEDGFMTPTCTFVLISPQTELPVHAVPIGHLVHDGEWKEDTARFVPPVLHLSGHHRWDELRTMLVDVLKSIHEKTKAQANSPVKTAISIYWPIVQQVFIQANTEQGTMTPATLLGCVQRVVGGFALACEVDDVLTLEDAQTFYNFAQLPYSYQKAYLRIKQGIGMCRAIDEKIDKFSLLGAAPPPPPTPTPKPDTRRSWLGKQI